MSQNPNMLRTMIGIGLTLIFVLGYAVYSNTVESEYYGYETTNTSESLELNQDDEAVAEWFLSTNMPITWVNVTVTGASQDSILRVQADGTPWFHSPFLGDNQDFPFNCEGDGDYSDIVETCDYSTNHEIIITQEESTLRGIVSSVLPVEGLGYLQADNPEEAYDKAGDLISEEATIITWRMGVYDDEGNALESVGIEMSVSMVNHELIDVNEFEIDPIEESVYSLATLIGCFSLMLVLPLIIYFSAIYKARKDEVKRAEAPPLEN